MAMTLRDLPGVDKVLSDPRINKLEGNYPHDLLVSVIRQQLDSERADITAGKTGKSLDGIVKAVLEQEASAMGLG